MRVFLTSPRCFCRRRLKSLVRSSFSSRWASSSDISRICWRRSLSFGTLRLPFDYKACGDWQFMACQACGFPGDLLAHTTDLEDHMSGLDHRYPVVEGAF